MTINQYQAPEGYRAVKPPDRTDKCAGCAFRAPHDGNCMSRPCHPGQRPDRQHVIFVPHLETQIESLKRAHEIEIEKLKCDHRDELTRQQANLYKRVLSSLEWMKT